jgi:hypothetical protein
MLELPGHPPSAGTPLFRWRANGVRLQSHSTERLVQVARDRLVHVPLRSRGDDYLRHSGQLVERRPFAASRLGQALLRPLPCFGNGIEDLRDASGIRVCVVERRSEKRTRKSSLLHMSALGEPRELPCVLVVKGHVDAGVSIGRRAGA